MFLSLVIPRCDDARLFSKLLEGVRALERILPYRFELVCVTDPGATLFRDLGNIQWIESDRPAHGCRVRAGMLGAKGLYRVLLDPRWTIEPEQLQLLLPPVQTHFDICIGSRLVAGSVCKNESRPAQAMRRAWSRLSGGVLRPPISDFLSPVQTYRADAARVLFSRVLEEGHAVTVEALALAHSMGLAIHEQPIDFEDARDMPAGMLREGMDLVLSLARIRLRLDSKAYPALNMPLQPPRVRRLHA